MRFSFNGIAPVAMLLSALATAPAHAIMALGDNVLEGSGTWNNDTFGSSGAVDVSLRIGLDDFSAQFDLGGGVFGFADPPPISVDGSIDEFGNITFGSLGDPFFGDVTGSIDATGVVLIEASNLPTSGSFNATGDFIGGAQLTGTFDGSVFDLDYFIRFAQASCADANDCLANGIEGTDFALGRIDASVAPVPLPAALPLMALALGGLVYTRRASKA